VTAPTDPVETCPPLILIAEDDVFLREMIGAKLTAHRYRVVEAAGGDQALASLERGGFDVLVTDIMMPGGPDGWAVAKRARVIHPDIAVVYSSSRPADGARQVGGSLFLRKPYSPDAIVAAVRRLTAWRGEAGPLKG